MTFVKEFLCFLDAVKSYHWQTQIYARHIASDELHKAFSKKVDEFVETYYGSYGGRPVFSDDDTISLKNCDDDSAVAGLQEFRKYVDGPLSELIQGNNGLAHLRDEMLALIDHTLYLFTFH